MKFLIEMNTLAVTPLPQGTSWGQLPRVTHNGQHHQLAGFALVEYHPSSDELVLQHPDTSPTTGHQDIKYYSRPRNEKPGVSIVMYSHWQEIDFANDEEVKHHWPTGGWHLFKTIIVAEEYLQREIGYEPRLARHLVHTFQNASRLVPKIA